MGIEFGSLSITNNERSLQAVVFDRINKKLIKTRMKGDIGKYFFRFNWDPF